MKQVSFLSEKHFSDLALYLEHFPAKLAPTFLDMIEDKYGIQFCVAVFVRYTEPSTDLADLDRIVLHSGKRIVTSPLVLYKEMD